MAAANPDFFEKDTPHGCVKRVMWLKYLQSFIAKTQQSSNIDKTIICDVFAGTGIYEQNGWSTCFTDYGSPLIAVRAAIGYFIRKNDLPNTFPPISGANPDYTEDEALTLQYKIDLYFVEKDTENYESLIENTILFFNFHGIPCVRSSPRSGQARVSSTDENFPIRCNIFKCEFVELNAPDVPHNARMATFIDPFGFKMIPWRSVSKFVGEHKELFINLMTSFMNRFFMQNLDTISLVFGLHPAELQTLRNEDSRSNFVDRLANLYVEKLKVHLEAELEMSNYTLTFEVRNKGNVRLYHLIFATSHMEGLKSMKESFNRGTQEQHKFSLSDFKILRRNIPLNLGNKQDPEAVANVIFNEFKGRQAVSIKDIEMFVWRNTPYVYRKTPLANLEREGRIVNVVGSQSEIRQRRFKFPDYAEWLISFASESPDGAIPLNELENLSIS